jgi:hypothetical protein
MSYISVIIIIILTGAPGLFFLIVAYENLKKFLDMMSTPTSRVFDVQRNPRAYLNGLVEVMGYINCDEHLQGPYTSKSCVFYEVVEQNRIRTVSRSGSKTTVTHSYRDVYRNLSQESFFIQDQTERLEVNPEGFEIQGVKTFKEKYPIKSPMTERGFFERMFAPTPTGETIVGKRRTEMILPPLQKVYAIGTLLKVEDRLVLSGQTPETGSNTGIISLRSERQVKAIKFAIFAGNLLVALILLGVAVGTLYAKLYEIGFFG